MNAGSLEQVGPPAEIYERPNSRFVAGFVGEVNLLEGDVVAAEGRPALRVGALDQPIPLPADADAPEGALVAVAVRPEKLRLSPARPAGFALMAKVAAIDYQGPVSLLRLSTPTGASLKAQLPSAAAVGFSRGSTLWTYWEAGDAVVLGR
jgi:ABC-type Fe3+/spermidine/putrescine transport system ATPase subunit